MTGPVMTGKYPYGAWLIRAAICDLADEENVLIHHRGDTDFRFELPVFGNSSTFEIRLVDIPARHAGETDSCELTLQMPCPADGLTKEGMRRAMHYILDSISQRIENELQKTSDA